LATLFFLPVVAAYLFYLFGWKPAGTVNYGELVDPPRAVENLNVHMLDGHRVRFFDLLGKWSLIYFGSAECLTACEKDLYKMRQVHLAQAKNQGRVQRVFVVTDPRALAMLKFTLKEYPGMQIITGPREAVLKLVKGFSLPVGSPLDGLDRVYLVDPIGNFMLSYPADADPNGIRKDLVRLLKISRIG
jgi:cytochrome oxidase Cu insertion factor (SCO1/SenC/PrrC family)